MGTTVLLFCAVAASVLACVLSLSIRNQMGQGGIDLSPFQSDMRDEFARNRKEASETAQSQREELRNNLGAFEKRLDDNAKAQHDLLRERFEDLLKQLTTKASNRLMR